MFQACWDVIPLPYSSYPKQYQYEVVSETWSGVEEHHSPSKVNWLICLLYGDP